VKGSCHDQPGRLWLNGLGLKSEFFMAIAMLALLLVVGAQADSSLRAARNDFRQVPASLTTTALSTTKGAGAWNCVYIDKYLMSECNGRNVTSTLWTGVDKTSI